MNKKLTTIVSAIALGGVMFSATAYAAIAGTSGYDVYKQAIFKTYAVNSITPKTAITVKDNGNLLVKVDSTIKVNKDSESMSSNVAIDYGNEHKTMDIYRQENKTIIKNSDSGVYDVMAPEKERKHKESENEKLDASRIKDIENVADALIGNIQNYITLNDNNDGSKDVSLQLSDNQISPVVNAVASLVVKNAGHEIGHKEFSGHGDDFLDVSLIKDKVPQLVDNIKVSQVKVDAKINKDNLIGDQTENFVITGTDAAGKNHEIEVSVSTNFSDFNNTTPDKVNLAGKKVNLIQHKRFED